MRFGFTGIGSPRKQRGATFLGMLTIGGILALGVYAGIRLVPLYMENMAISRALKQTAEALKAGEASPTAIRQSLDRRWTIEDIKTIDVRDIEINKVGNGVEVRAAYRAEAPFVANVSLVVDFDTVAIIGGG